jgi:hypothetical protein
MPIGAFAKQNPLVGVVATDKTLNPQFICSACKCTVYLSLFKYLIVYMKIMHWLVACHSIVLPRDTPSTIGRNVGNVIKPTEESLYSDST